MATQLATTEQARPPKSQSPEAERFNLMQRQAWLFASSPLIPESLRKGTPEQAMANCYIAMSIADRMGEDRMTVMQNIHVIHGNAGFKTKYMIARANASGKFSDDIDWEISGAGPTLSATAFATLAKSGKRVEMTVNMDMAKAEGWTSNKKYQTMPEVMLRYRSASFLVNMYAPEVMLGYRTAEEVEDLGFAASEQPERISPAMLADHSETVGEATGEIAQEGRTDEQHGDQHTDPDDSARAQVVADDIVTRAKTATKLAQITNLAGVLETERGTFTQAQVGEVEMALSDARARI
jgi:hypothetical protein